MSAAEHNGEQIVPESKTKVKVVRNAKGDAQWEVTVVEGFDQDELERVRVAAVAAHQALAGALA